MRVLLAGASGFLGSAFVTRLGADGHVVRRLVRRAPTTANEYQWDPYAAQLPAAALRGVDTVVNLAGAPIAHWPWSAAYKRKLVESRLSTTELLAQAIATLDEPRPVLMQASAVGYYGKDRAETVDESAAPGEGFLADLVKQWEQAASPAVEAGARVVLLRSGVVLGHGGGMLAALTLPFKAGVGGRLGNGSQALPTISLTDWLAAVSLALADDEALSGPVNLVSPETGTNADLTRILGRLLHRPTLMRVPAAPLRVVLGDLSSELLGGLRVRPARLLDVGFVFAHPDLESQLAAALADPAAGQS